MHLFLAVFSALFSNEVLIFQEQSECIQFICQSSEQSDNWPLSCPIKFGKGACLRLHLSSVGDAVGYAMRGGKIYVKGDAGYRAGIHMKEYKDKVPVIVIGGVAGSFLGEYQAGGIIVVLGLERGDRNIVGHFPCTGMHGGMMYLRGDLSGIKFPSQVTARKATPEEIDRIKEYVFEYCQLFGYDVNKVLDSSFTVVTPDSKNPYKQMYVAT